MKTTAKDVILICKGWYDKNLYPTILDALKQYYRKEYSEVYEDNLNESFLYKIVLTDVMREIAEKYPDRLRTFAISYITSGGMFAGTPDENNKDYDYQLFYRIVNFLANLKMRGDGLLEIDTEEYFTEDLEHKSVLSKDII